MTKFSLRSVLIFPYVALVICLALAIGLLSYNTGSRAVQTVSDHLLKETVNRLSQAIDRHLVGSITTLETAFPAGISVQKDIREDLDGIRTRLWTASSLYLDPNNYVYYGNQAGQAVGLYRESIHTGELRVKFEPEEHRTFYTLNGINGVPQFSSVEEKNFDPRVRPWFQAGLKNQKDIWTSVYIDFRTHNLVATRARRIQDEQGEFEGVVATDMSLKSLNDFISSLNVSENGLAFIVEPNGLLIASSHSPNIKKDQTGANIRVAADQSGNELISDIYLKMEPLISGDMKNMKPETFSFTDGQGREIHVAYNKFEDKAGLKWINVVAIPSEDFMEGIERNVIQTLLIGILATIFVSVIGLLILHWVTKDLKLLSDAVNKVGSNYLEEPIEINRKDEIGDLAKNFSAMQKRLHTDYLTGLPNRNAFEQQVKAAVEKRRHDSSIAPFTVLFFDLNNFKRINDVFGHDVGDQALKEFALRLKANTPQSDLVARYAGDEFVIMLNGVQSDEALEPILTKIKTALSDAFKLSDTLELTLGTAIGVAYYPKDGENLAELLIVADKKMYADKANIKKKENIFNF